MVFLVLVLLMNLIGTGLQCIPIELAWDITGKSRDGCIDTTAFFYSKPEFGGMLTSCLTFVKAVSSTHIALDIWIILLPIKTLLSLQLPGREKGVLLGVFGLGVFSLVASIVRLYSISLFTLSKDPFFDAVPINQWSIVEVNVAIICASIPTLKPLLSKTTRDRIASSRTRSNHQYAPAGSVSWPNSYKGEPLPSPGIQLKQMQVNERELPRDVDMGTFLEDIELATDRGEIRRTTTVRVSSQTDENRR